MENHMDDAQRSSGNRRNGKSNKEIRTSDGTIDIDTPRDRRSNFEPQLVKETGDDFSREPGEEDIRDVRSRDELSGHFQRH